MSDKPTDFPQPLGGNEMPRFAGPGTMMRLPAVDSAAGMDAVFIGIPLDIGTSNRAGTRFGPKQIRAESVLMRPYNMWTRAAPFDSLQVGDLGDVPINTFELKDAVARITAFYNEGLAHDVVPLTLGGDHTLTLPVLRAVAAKHGPVGLIHVDAHADINDHMFGEKIAHGTPFRRAVEEGLIDSHRTWQIGLRGTGYTAEDFDWARDRGFTVVQAEELWHRSATPLIAQARAALGDGPVYLSFDIDSLDPGFAPGTGTPEIGGVNSFQAQQVVRELSGVNLVGADLVEVSPPFDAAGGTAWLGVSIMFEIMCVLAEAIAARRDS